MAVRRFNVNIEAPGAREIRVHQTNHGGMRHIKNSAIERIKFKTWGKVKNKAADNPAILKVRVFWKPDAGGGDDTYNFSVFRDQDFTLKSPVARGGVAASSDGIPTNTYSTPANTVADALITTGNVVQTFDTGQQPGGVVTSAYAQPPAEQTYYSDVVEEPAWKGPAIAAGAATGLGLLGWLGYKLATRGRGDSNYYDLDRYF